LSDYGLWCYHLCRYCKSNGSPQTKNISTNIGFVIFWLLPEETFVVGERLAGYLLNCLIRVEGDVG